MCLPKPPKDNTAQIAAKQEAEKQARIAQGKTAIDEAFMGFNQPFFDQYKQDYTGYYYPQLDDQFKEANKRLTLQLAKTGNLTGSVGAKQLADLKEYHDTRYTGITNDALSAMQALQANIDARKSQLYADNAASADPGNAAASAASAAQALQPTQPSSPLANTFADFFNNLSAASQIYNYSKPYGNNQGGGVQSYNTGGNGSYQVIGG